MTRSFTGFARWTSATKMLWLHTRCGTDPVERHFSYGFLKKNAARSAENVCNIQLVFLMDFFRERPRAVRKFFKTPFTFLMKSLRKRPRAARKIFIHNSESFFLWMSKGKGRAQRGTFFNIIQYITCSTYGFLKKKAARSAKNVSNRTRVVRSLKE